MESARAGDSGMGVTLMAAGFLRPLTRGVGLGQRLLVAAWRTTLWWFASWIAVATASVLRVASSMGDVDCRRPPRVGGDDLDLHDIRRGCLGQILAVWSDLGCACPVCHAFSSRSIHGCITGGGMAMIWHDAFFGGEEGRLGFQ